MSLIGWSLVFCMHRAWSIDANVYVSEVEGAFGVEPCAYSGRQSVSFDLHEELSLLQVNITPVRPYLSSLPSGQTLARPEAATSAGLLGGIQLYIGNGSRQVHKWGRKSDVAIGAVVEQEPGIGVGRARQPLLDRMLTGSVLMLAVLVVLVLALILSAEIRSESMLRTFGKEDDGTEVDPIPWGEGSGKTERVRELEVWLRAEVACAANCEVASIADDASLEDLGLTSAGIARIFHRLQAATSTPDLVFEDLRCGKDAFGPDRAYWPEADAKEGQHTLVLRRVSAECMPELQELRSLTVQEIARRWEKAKFLTISSVPPLFTSHDLLECRIDAEDECVRDLRRAIVSEARLARRPQRSTSSPACGKRAGKNPFPPEVRACDVMQPGGFRRHHIRHNCTNGISNPHARSRLAELLVPALVDDADGINKIGEADAASNLSIAIVICQCFLGTGFMVVPKGFQSAGLVGGPLCLVFVYALEIFCMLNLIECRKYMGAGCRYEDLAKSLGCWAPRFVAFMILLTQIGFACILFTFVSSNILMLFPEWNGRLRFFILLPVLIPIMWVRSVDGLALANSAGIVMSIAACTYMFWYGAGVLHIAGAQKVNLFNTSNADWLLWLGSCAYIFEGINNVLPLYESAKDKACMVKLLISITLALTIAYTVFGCIHYLSFGEDTASIATLNLVEGSMVGRLVPLAIVLAGLCRSPISLYILFQMYEPRIGWSPRAAIRTWQQNLGRTIVVLAVMGLTWAGGEQLQNILALVGGLGCSTLALIVPSALHITICKPRGAIRVLDALVFSIGIGVLILATMQALRSWRSE